MADKLSILTLTWNMSGIDTSRSVKEWENSIVGRHWIDWLQGKTQSTEKLSNKIGSFDIIVVGLQEVHRKSEFGRFFLKTINSSISDPKEQYLAVEAKNKSLARFTGHSFDQHLHVFSKVKHHFAAPKRGSTCFGAGGSCVKGSVAIHLSRQDEHYIFVTSHFPFVAEDDRGDLARLAAYRQTVDKLLLEMRTIDGTEVPLDKVTIVWGGDFNYRTDRMVQFANIGRQSVLHKDRLNSIRALGKEPWAYNLGWRECGEVKQDARFKPSYEPTFRMIQLPKTATSAEIAEQGRLRYTGDKTAYSTKRKPAWCDRWFIKALAPENLSSKANKFSTGSVESDHDAVFAEISLSNVIPGRPLVQGHIEEWHDFTDIPVLSERVTIPICAVCTMATPQMRICAVCDQHYCSRDCQTWDWKKNDHSDVCAKGQGSRPCFDRVTVQEK